MKKPLHKLKVTEKGLHLAGFDGTDRTVKKTEEPLQGYRGSRMISRKGPLSARVLVGIPMTGTVRSEWMFARYGQVIPCNWSQSELIHWIDTFSPLNFMVADARNLIATKCVEDGFEWLFYIDHDVVMPPHTILRMNEHMIRRTAPVVGGLYFTKGVPSEPLVYRGIGTGYYDNWKLGDLVWVDGMGMGCTLIHRSVLEVMHQMSEEYMLGHNKVRRIFQTPANAFFDLQTGAFNWSMGTEDIRFLRDMIEKGVLEKAGWKKHAKMQYPYCIDTQIFCKHINSEGTMFPANGEERQYMKAARKVR